MKKLILLGTATSVFNPPYENQDYEFWGTGTCFGNSSTSHREIKRIDLGFEIHKMDRMKKLIDEGKDLQYNKFKCPIMVQNANDKLTREIIEKPITFPLQDMLKFAGKKYFTSSFSYMVVYAAMLGYKDIGLYGILLCFDGEFTFQKPCIEYWCNLLTQRENIHFYVPEDSELFNSSKLYGYDEYKNEYKVKSRSKTLWDIFDKSLGEFELTTNEYQKNQGILQTLDFLQKRPSGEEIQSLYDIALKKATERGAQLKLSVNQMNQFKGALQNMYFYDDKLE